MSATEADKTNLSSKLRVTVREMRDGALMPCGAVFDQIIGAADEIDRLRAIVHRLPKTADGVPITLGDDLWSNDSRGTFEWCVTEIHTHDVCGKFHGAPCVFEQYGNCYSTREAAEKARNDMSESSVLQPEAAEKLRGCEA